MTGWSVQVTVSLRKFYTARKLKLNLLEETVISLQEKCFPCMSDYIFFILNDSEIVRLQLWGRRDRFFPVRKRQFLGIDSKSPSTLRVQFWSSRQCCQLLSRVQIFDSENCCERASYRSGVLFLLRERVTNFIQNDFGNLKPVLSHIICFPVRWLCCYPLVFFWPFYHHPCWPKNWGRTKVKTLLKSRAALPYLNV